jgi:hypothetical protein
MRVQRVRPEVHQMLDVLGSVSPAFVVNHRLDVLASNYLARALLVDFDAQPARERNFARFILFSPAAKDLYRDWTTTAQTMVANLRLSSGRHPDDTRLNELIGEACVKVPEFNAWWASHRLDDCGHGAQRLHHPVVGDLTLHHEALTFSNDSDQVLCLYTAQPGSASGHALALLASWSAPGTTPAASISVPSERPDSENPAPGRGPAVHEQR